MWNFALRFSKCHVCIIIVVELGFPTGTREKHRTDTVHILNANFTPTGENRKIQLIRLKPMAVCLFVVFVRGPSATGSRALSRRFDANRRNNIRF